MAKVTLPKGKSRYLFAGGALLAVAIGFYSSWEGTRYTAYRDVGGVLTICEGLTGPWVHEGLTMTRAQCDVRFAEEIIKHEAGLLACAPEMMTIPDPSYVAINDWAFNVGTGAACKSTLIKLVRSGDLAGACAQLSKWVYVKGVVINGLVKRRVTGDATRVSEQALCLQGVKGGV
jgi:lysozyme